MYNVIIAQTKKLNSKKLNIVTKKRKTSKRENPSYNELDQNLPIRINKFLAESGVSSRRKVDEMISQGLVKVNGQVVTELGTKVLRTDFITVNGDPIREIIHYIYILLNKPKNVITTTSDDLHRTTVLDIVRKDDRIFPVGRLDRNTTGVILLTNDGDLAFKLTHPKFEIERTYIAKLDKPLQIEHAKLISAGVELDNGEKTGECELFINPEDNTKVMLTLREGKNREVRRIFAAFDYEVKQLDRKEFAGLTTRGLNRGDYRHLTSDEVLNLKKIIK